MEMVSLFLTIFFIGLCLISLWVCFKKLSPSVFSLWNNKKKLTLLNELIHNNIYDNFTVKRSITHYVSPSYQESPPYERQPGKRQGITKRKNLFRRIDIFLDHDVSCRHMLILADSGMGKTCFLLNYFIHNARRIKKDRHKIILVPLGLKKADELILSPSDKKNSVLFLDGLDEDITAGKNLQNRLRQLIKLSQKYKRLVITCSTDSFPIDKNMPVKNGYERIGPENINDSHYYEFRKLYLSVFNLNDIRKYINSRFSIWVSGKKKKIQSFVKKTASVKITPLLLSYFQEMTEQDTTIHSNNDWYEKIIGNWITHEPNWDDKSSLDLIAQRLAVDIYLQRKNRGQEVILQNDLVKKAKEWGMTLYSLENSMRALINQTQDGSFKFAHRSFMEYFFVKRLISGDKSCYQVPLTTKMGKFLLEILENKNPENLKTEFNWLSQFKLAGHGLAVKPSDKNGTNLFKSILKKNQQFNFLAELNGLIQNPIFYKFGWDSKLNDNLKKAVYQKKASVMKLSGENETVMINHQEIEIMTQDQKKQRILINEKDLKEYNSLSDNSLILKLSHIVGSKGLNLLNNINRSKNFCVLPDLKTLQTFTLYFWIK